MVGMRVLCSSPAIETWIGRLLLVCVVVSQCTGTVASLIAFGDSYSDNGQGANKAVQAALGTTQVGYNTCRVVCRTGSHRGDVRG